MRISCFGCKIFDDMSPGEKVQEFRFDFQLLHKDNESLYAQCQEAEEKIKKGEKKVDDYLSESTLTIWSVIARCFPCRFLHSNDEEARKIYYAYLKKEMLGNDKESLVKESFVKIAGTLKWENLHEVQNKLWNIGAWPDKRLLPYGIGQRPYFNEDYANHFSEEDIKLLVLLDYKKKQKMDRYMDLFVDLEKPLDKLMDSFRKLVKEKQTAYNTGVRKKDGRRNTPDFETWHNYLLAYTLKEKGVCARLIKPVWPNKKLTRKEVADLLFPNEEELNRLQKLDRYIREAKKLVVHAYNTEGPFKCCNKLDLERMTVPFLYV